jgi:predicted nucleic acid-binding protein
MPKYMFDTNIFGQILKKMPEPERMLKSPNEFFVTHIQRDELNASPDWIKEKLLTVFQVVPQQNIATTSVIVGFSRVGGAKIGNGAVYESILVQLDKVKPMEQDNNIKDALIGETAVKNEIVLITNDKALN